MPLLNKKILNDLEQNKYAFDDIIPNDAPVIVKYFNPVYFGSWFVLEGQKIFDDWEFFGVEELDNKIRFTDFSLSFLETMQLPYGEKIKIDENYNGTHGDLKKMVENYGDNYQLF
jgi:hypothetical protein|tara:strand:+ start:117 stop:461 length:345 start_codon:yes stop_codon:yes gene_type:complete